MNLRLRVRVPWCPQQLRYDGCMKALKVAVLVLYVELLLVVMLVSSIGERALGGPKWVEGIYLAGCFVFGWYQRRIYGAWQRLWGVA